MLLIFSGKTPLSKLKNRLFVTATEKEYSKQILVKSQQIYNTIAVGRVNNSFFENLKIAYCFW